METDINLLNQYFILDHQYQRVISIFLIIFIIGLNLYSFYFIRIPLDESFYQLDNIEKIFFSEQEMIEKEWLNRNLIKFNIKSWHNILEDLLSDIAYINSIHFFDDKWEVRGELNDIESYQVLYERVNELRLLNFNINFNRVGPLQSSSFLLFIKAGDFSE